MQGTANLHEQKGSTVFKFKGLMQSSGWISPAYVSVDADGRIITISSDLQNSKIPVEDVHGYAIPGFQNAHSHAFQYAMAGRAEIHSAETQDDFWSWREAMYECALTMDPDQMQSVATMLYIEMLKRGYTQVAEFQYVHHNKNGKPYQHLSEMSMSLLAAAANAGIKITIVPVYYNRGGFGQEPQPRQRRFIIENPDQYFKLLEETVSACENITTANAGFGVHSLRASTTDHLVHIVKAGPRGLPFHIHAAEQLKEVEDSLALLKQRPVEWLLNNIDLNEKFHLVHCTHLTDDEVKRLARSRANVVLCPGTEGNLGDGIFRLADFVRHDGSFSIGTDSHISLNPIEDLRWLDYSQRLTTHKRNTFDDGATTLVSKTFFAGKMAMGDAQSQFFEQGKPFDAVIYSADYPLLSAANPKHILPVIVYTADSSAMLGTLVNGRWIVRQQHHQEQERVYQQYLQTLKTLSL